MHTSSEKFITANQANMQELKGLSNKLYSGLEKLTELNMTTSKALMASAFHSAKDLLEVKNLQELVSLQTNMVKPLTDKISTYGWSVYEVSAETGGHLNQVFEDKLTQTQAAFTEMVNSVLKDAPSGTEPAVALFKSAVNAGQSAIGAAQSSAKKAIKVAETSMTEMSNQALSTTTATPAPTAK